ncbi:chitin deacetylase [Haplosporangium sp. Z 27]|nr:chitin deacetylase [Haplosporangium sp. Z 27]
MSLSRALLRLHFIALVISILNITCAQTVPGKSAIKYPEAKIVPPTNSSEVQAWLKDINLSGAPDIGLNYGTPPSCPAEIASNACYWTCQGCAADDIVGCPDPDVWGLTFDDGPTEVTPSLLKALQKENVKATFFLIGGNVQMHPHIVKEQLKQGHHLASHTWSHHALTTLTNEQIVAEMKWTEKAIEDATGYKVKYMRPPYGDIDNRVRFVLKKLGYIVVDWTGDAFDTNDWRIPVKQSNASYAEGHFKESLLNYKSDKSLLKKGFISLEHDLSLDTIGVAQKLIPFAVENGLIIQSVANCLRDATPYAAMNGVVINANSSHHVIGSSGKNGRTQPQSDKDRDKAKAASVDSAYSSAGASRFRGQHFLGDLLTSSSSVMRLFVAVLSFLQTIVGC